MNKLRSRSTELQEAPERVHDLLTRWYASDEPALASRNEQISYRQMTATAFRLAGSLMAAGLQPGDRCAVYLPKGVEECWAVFAISMAGGVLVPVNPMLKAAQVAHICQDCEPTVLLTNEAMHNAVVAPATASLSNAPVVITIESTLSPGVEDLTPDELAALPGNRRLCTDLAAILYTSGSTGKPKGVMLTHANLVAGTRIVRTYLSITSRDRLLSVLPLSFDYGLNQLLTTVEQQALLVPFTFMFGDQLVTALEQHQITGLAGVPTIWAILTQAAPKLKQIRLSALRYVSNSGGPVPSATVQRLRQALPDTRVVLMYGLTEAFRSTWLDPDELDRRPTSIGKAIPECEVFVLTKDGRRAAPGEPGILIHRGPTVSRGYWRRPEESARVLRPNPLVPADEGPDIVCYSGDLVTSDAEGFLYFVGRDDAMIKSSGYRISPAEVEEALMATGSFVQVAVIGLPDPAAGQKVHAIAVAAQAALAGTTADKLSAAALQACARELPAYMVPRQIELVSALPTTPNGKVDHKRMRADAIAAAEAGTGKQR